MNELEEWLVDAAQLHFHDYPEEHLSLDELHELLYTFVREDFEYIREIFGEVSVNQLGDILAGVIGHMERTHPNVEGDKRYKYQALDKNGEPYFETTDDFQTARNNFVWGTYGKSGKDPLKYVKLVDCDDEHLTAILETQKSAGMFTLDVVKDILKERECKIELDEELFTL